jgi:hypothetical protein
MYLTGPTNSFSPFFFFWLTFEPISGMLGGPPGYGMWWGNSNGGTLITEISLWAHGMARIITGL